MSIYHFSASERGGVPIEAGTELTNPATLVRLMLMNAFDPVEVTNPIPVQIGPKLWPPEHNSWRHDMFCPLPGNALVLKRYVPAPEIQRPERFGHSQLRVYRLPRVYTFLPVIQAGSPWYPGRLTLTELLVDAQYVPNSAK